LEAIGAINKGMAWKVYNDNTKLHEVINKGYQKSDYADAMILEANEQTAAHNVKVFQDYLEKDLQDMKDYAIFLEDPDEDDDTDEVESEGETEAGSHHGVHGNFIPHLIKMEDKSMKTTLCFLCPFMDDWVNMVNLTITAHGIQPHCIVSMDETNCYFDQSKKIGSQLAYIGSKEGRTCERVVATCSNFISICPIQVNLKSAGNPNCCTINVAVSGTSVFL
jgi:hypothetical protein